MAAAKHARKLYEKVASRHDVCLKEVAGPQKVRCAEHSTVSLELRNLLCPRLPIQRSFNISSLRLAEKLVCGLLQTLSKASLTLALHLTHGPSKLWVSALAVLLNTRASTSYTPPVKAQGNSCIVLCDRSEVEALHWPLLLAMTWKRVISRCVDQRNVIGLSGIELTRISRLAISRAC